MKTTIAHFVSVVFQPLLMPLYGTCLLVFSNPYMFPDAYENRLDIMRITLNTFFFPAIIVILLAGLRFVKGINLRNRQDRTLPYIAVMMCYIWTFYVYYKNQFNPIITYILLGSCIAIVLAFLINVLFMKVSMHTTGGGGLVAMSLILMPFYYSNPIAIFLLSILIAGAIGTARLILQAHTEREVYYGYLVGFFSFMLTANIFPL
jgi:hypothetical protein